MDAITRMDLFLPEYLKLVDRLVDGPKTPELDKAGKPIRGLSKIVEDYHRVYGLPQEWVVKAMSEDIASDTFKGPWWPEEYSQGTCYERVWERRRRRGR